MRLPRFQAGNCWYDPIFTGPAAFQSTARPNGDDKATALIGRWDQPVGLFRDEVDTEGIVATILPQQFECLPTAVVKLGATGNDDLPCAFHLPQRGFLAVRHQ